MKNQKFDVFNFFYSIGAVIILIGVIAKFLEWKLQDPLLLTGLGVEALVFTMSSIQYKTKAAQEYKWERLFPELVDTAEVTSSLSGIQKKIEDLSNRYFDGMNEYVERFDSLNSTIVKGSFHYQESLNQISDHLSDSAVAFSSFRENVSKVTRSFV